MAESDKPKARAPQKKVVKAVTPGSVTAKQRKRPEVTTQKRIVVSSKRISQPVETVQDEPSEADGTLSSEEVGVVAAEPPKKPAFMLILGGCLAVAAVVAVVFVITNKGKRPDALPPAPGGGGVPATPAGVPEPKPPDLPNKPLDTPVQAKIPGPQKGLVGYWTFDDNLKDATERTGDGTMESKPEFVNGAMGRAIKLNGKQRVQIIPSSVHDNMLETISISFWVKNPGGVKRAKQAGIVTRGKSHWQVMLGQSHHTRFNLMEGVGPDYPSVWGKDLHDAFFDRWIHVVAVKNGKISTLYVDGEFYRKQENAAPRLPKSTAPIWVGGNYDFPAGHKHSRPFTGMVDDLRIYNRAITEAEVTALFKLR